MVEYEKESVTWNSPRIESKVERSFKLIKALDGAIERGEFHINYQPKMDPNKHRVVGMEALVYWHHPMYGEIAPEELIPLANRTRYIIPLGEWVLRSACIQLKKWHQAGYPQLHVAINLSVYQLQAEGFVESVTQILQELDLRPHFLQFEVTESTNIYYNQEGIKRLHELKLLGVQIMMDDFGIGYSALSCLQRLPIDGIKIGGAITSQIEKESVYQLIKAMIQLARGLRLKVVVEGVDTLERVNALKKWRVDEVQGYLFRVPIPADELTDKLRQMGREEG